MIYRHDNHECCKALKRAVFLLEEVISYVHQPEYDRDPFEQEVYFSLMDEIHAFIKKTNEDEGQ